MKQFQTPKAAKVYPNLFTLRHNFRAFPRELEEAAMIDGASWVQSLFKVILPVAIPGTVAVALFCFSFCWGHLIYALAFMFDHTAQPFTAAIPRKLIRGDVF